MGLVVAYSVDNLGCSVLGLVVKMTFVTFTKDQFDKVIDTLGINWGFSQAGFEIVYELKLKNGLEIWIYSSIDTRSYKSRPIGADAIRVAPMYNSRALTKKQRRVHRTTGWEERLVDRIMHTLREVKKDYKLGACGHLLRKVNGKFGLFWGCLNYPSCKNTMEIKSDD